MDKKKYGGDKSGVRGQNTKTTHQVRAPQNPAKTGCGRNEARDWKRIST